MKYLLKFSKAMNFPTPFQDFIHFHYFLGTQVLKYADIYRFVSLISVQISCERESSYQDRKQVNIRLRSTPNLNIDYFNNLARQTYSLFVKSSRSAEQPC